MQLTPAERLLQELGITEPQEIDVEAIAHYLGARVRFRPLDGCEARIIGRGNEAIITVNDHSSPRRKRFSIAHELGHWRFHRGKSHICRAEDFRPRDALSPERVADAYAADLLMPNYLFSPIASRHGRLDFKVVAALAQIFETSTSATAIRLIEGNRWPAFVVCHGLEGRKWFARASSVPTKWFPRDALDADSFAFDVLHGGKVNDPMPRKIGADAWFDRWDAEQFEVLEQSIRSGPGEVLSLILITDDHMIDNNSDYR